MRCEPQQPLQARSERAQGARLRDRLLKLGRLCVLLLLYLLARGEHDCPLAAASLQTTAHYSVQRKERQEHARYPGQAQMRLSGALAGRTCEGARRCSNCVGRASELSTSCTALSRLLLRTSQPAASLYSKPREKPTTLIAPQMERGKKREQNVQVARCPLPAPPFNVLNVTHTRGRSQLPA